jgi:hypothetical protein
LNNRDGKESIAMFADFDRTLLFAPELGARQDLRRPGMQWLFCLIRALEDFIETYYEA